jgi:hypothetical protein
MATKIQRTTAVIRREIPSLRSHNMRIAREGQLIRTLRMTYPDLNQRSSC